MEGDMEDLGFFRRSNLMLLVCGAFWSVCTVLFYQLIVFKFDERPCGNAIWIGPFLGMMYSEVCMSMFQRDLHKPSPVEFLALPTIVNVIIYLFILLPFFFIKQVITGQFNYSSNDNVALVLALVLTLSHVPIGLLRFWKGSYHVLVCLLVAIVTTSFSVQVEGHENNKFFILGLSVILVSLFHCYFWVRSVEVSQAQEIKDAQKKIQAIQV